MSYRVEFTPIAARQLGKLPRPIQRRIQGVVELLQTNPRPPKATRLKGDLAGLYRIRTGDYRVVYLIQDKKLVICIVRIGDRKDIYRNR